jgi:hypothetical protein
MISIVYSTRKENPEFKQHLKNTCGILNDKLEIIEYVNEGKYSLTELYNKGLNESKYDKVVFCHDDINFETDNWGKKLLKLLSKNEEFGIVGVAGSRELPKSGKWWENPNHIYGQVYHKHNGKKWLSKYSDKTPNFIDDVVIVDGLFFLVDKNKIKVNFDETVEGFHFYDVDFCYRNFKEGVRVGVVSDIDITHMSIGMTNEEWEKNREIFSEKYSNDLPVKSNKIFNKHSKLKVLIGCLLFNDYTGSELHVYELVKELTKQNCEVHIVSQLGQKMTRRIERYGVKCFSIHEPPGYKLGDGKWGFNSQHGTSPSEKGKLYKVNDVKYDIIHINHKPIGLHLLKLYPNIPAINTVHSEVIPNLEEPIVHPNVKHYIAIRESIKDFIVNGWDISEEKVSVIYNPIDNERFKHYKNISKNVTLFVGTIDYLRKETIFDLVEYTKTNDKELWIVGENKSDYLDKLKENKHVKYYPSTWDVENYVKECNETASILMGRTTIEGWLCNKPGWIYQIDSSGNILSKEKQEVPENLDVFKSNLVAKQIIEEYKKII